MQIQDTTSNQALSNPLQVNFGANFGPTSPAKSETAIIFPCLLAPATTRGLLNNLITWTLLKALDASRGSPGFVPFDQATKTFLLRFMSSQSMHRRLNNGEGIFWHRTTNRQGETNIWLTGAITLANLWELEHLTLRRVEVTLADLEGKPTSDQRAVLYAATLATITHQDSPIARLSIRNATGISEATQRRYQKIVGPTVLKATPNFQTTDHECQSHAVPHRTHQLGNSYKAQLPFVGWGQARERNREDRRNFKEDGDNRPATMPSLITPTRYTRSPKACIRLLHKGYDRVLLRSSEQSNVRFGVWEDPSACIISDGPSNPGGTNGPGDWQSVSPGIEEKAQTPKAGFTGIGQTW